MPLYEFVMEFQDRTEVRIGDRAPRVGDTLIIGGREWMVDARVAGEGRAAARFLLQAVDVAEAACEPTGRELAEAGSHGLLERALVTLDELALVTEPEVAGLARAEHARPAA